MALSAQEFVKVLKISYAAIKKADPEAVVVIGGFTGLHVYNEWAPGFIPMHPEFVETVIREGKNYFDVLDVHMYRGYNKIHNKVQ